MRTVLVIVLVLATQVRNAEACACCDGQATRTPVGWTEAGGAVLLEYHSTMACEVVNTLEVWHASTKQAAGCYDLFGEPDKRITCESATFGVRTASGMAKPKPPSTRVLERFATKPVALDATKFRVRRHRPKSAGDIQSPLRLAVDIDVNGTWKQAWAETINSEEAFSDGAGTVHKMPVKVTVWPTPRGDRALLLVENENTAPGLGAWVTTVRWIDLPRP